MNRTLTSLTSLTAAAAATAMLVGCATDGTNTMTAQQRAALIGAGIGAIAGTVAGNQVEHSNTVRGTGAVLGAAAGAGVAYLWSNHMEKQKLAMQQATAGTPVQVTQTQDNRLKINIPADAGFATNSAVLNRNLHPILERMAQTLSTTATVSIIGHTDSTGSDAINNPLSQNRANAAANYLMSHGVAGNRIMASGMGSTQPVASNATEMGRAQNRRVEIYVYEAQQAR